MMNRQLKRAQKKQEERAEKLKSKKKEYRQDKRQRQKVKRTEAKTRTKPISKTEQKERAKRIPGRFSNIMTFVTLFFISLNSISPVNLENFWPDVLLKSAYYVFLGYFMTLWLARRGTPNPAVTTFAFSVLIGSGLELMKLVFRQPLDPFHIIFALPAAALGVVFARWIVNRQTT
jgi:Flp pilus assembly protein TadB